MLSRARRAAVPLLMLLLAVQSGVLAYPRLRRLVAPDEASPAARGQRLAAALGCFTCHGAEDTAQVVNPALLHGAPRGKAEPVPALTGRGARAASLSDHELRAAILDGHAASGQAGGARPARDGARVFQMPAYRAFLDDGQTADLLAWLRAASAPALPAEPLALRGAALAEELQCFRCHGPLGAGGRPNPGSFKGYTPGFWGADFEDLVRDDGELLQWIRDGASERMAGNPAAQHFLEQQVLQMPSYGTLLAPEELGALAAYVKWIHAGAAPGGRLRAGR